LVAASTDQFNTARPLVVDKTYCWEQFEKQGGRCALSGVQLTFRSDSADAETTASIDRIDSDVGYRRGNIQWVHKVVNKIKRNLDTDRFLELCRLVASPISSKKPSDACIVGKPHGNFKGYGNLFRTYWRTVLLGTDAGPAVSRRPIPCKITIEMAWKAFVCQRGRCALTGLELSFDKTTGRTKLLPGGSRKATYVRGTASLDRVNSAKGYVRGNIQWVHKDVNLMKWEMDEKEFKLWCRRIARHTAPARLAAQALSLQAAVPRPIKRETPTAAPESKNVSTRPDRLVLQTGGSLVR
jgi:hypothetical protein